MSPRTDRRGPSPADCRMAARRDRGCVRDRPARVGTMQRSGRFRVLGSDGRRRAAHRRASPRPRRLLRGPRHAHQDRLFTIALRMLRRPPRRRGARPGRVRPRLSGAGRLRRRSGSASSGCAVAGDDRAERRPQLGREAGRSGAPPRSSSPSPGGREPRDADAAPAAAAERRDAAGPPAAGCRRPTEPPSSSATSTACPTPRSPRPSAGPKAPSRPRSTAASPRCARCSRPPSGASARR